MKKTIKLTESQVNSLVQNIINENIYRNDLYIGIKELIRNSNSSHKEVIDVLTFIVNEMESQKKMRDNVRRRFEN